VQSWEWNEVDFKFAAGVGESYKEGMSEPIVFQKSPIVQKVEPGTYWWCACGRSKGQPFCDGSHKGTGLGPQKVEIAEAKTVAWCGCKHSGNKPFCDGTHSKLA
jgi:CDGSH-type Zn-finger protein